ncbi:MAG: zinc ribbon domain-containing protein [Chloroflexota bacterium]
MPSYQFRCRHCQHTFEERRPRAQAHDAAVCPVCGSQDTKKLLGSVMLNLSGRSPAASDSIPVPISSHAAGGCGCSACSCGATAGMRG